MDARHGRPADGTAIGTHRAPRDAEFANWIRTASVNGWTHAKTADAYVDAYFPSADQGERESLRRAFEDGIAMGRY